MFLFKTTPKIISTNNHRNQTKSVNSLRAQCIRHSISINSLVQNNILALPIHNFTANPHKTLAYLGLVIPPTNKRSTLTLVGKYNAPKNSSIS
jgi:hypothetical protein